MTPLFTLDSQGTAIWVKFPMTVVSKREVCWKLKITNNLWDILTLKGGGRQTVDIRSTFGVPLKSFGYNGSNSNGDFFQHFGAWKPKLHSKISDCDVLSVLVDFFH